MSIRRRETRDGVRYDVQWRLPDRTKRKKTFSTSALQSSSKPGWSLVAPRRVCGPSRRQNRTETVYRSWIASRPTSAPKSAADTRTTGDSGSNRGSATGRLQRSTTSPFSGGLIRCRRQGLVRGLSGGRIRCSRCHSTTPSTTAGSSRRTCDANQVPADAANYPHLSHRKGSRRSSGCLWGSGRRGVDPGLYRSEVRRADRAECRRRRHRRQAHPGSPVYHPGRRQTRRGQSEI